MFKFLPKIIVSICTILFFVPNYVFAENISVTPMVIDHVTEARDILTKDITIKNNDGNHVRVYASVNEIELDGNNEIKSFVPASMSDRTESVTSWIEINRGRIDIDSGNEAKIPLTIRINPNAKPGNYHAFVGFASGANRDEAEKKIMAGQGSGVVVRIAIDEKTLELLKLSNFQADQIVYNNKDNNFTFSLENIGDIPQTPKGEVIVYDSRGIELTSIEVNKENKTINPGEKVDFIEPIPFMDRIGKNKAYLSISYGENNLANIYDINFYYSIPWMYLVVILSVLIFVPLFLTLFLKRMTRSSYHNIDAHEATDVPLFVRKQHDHKVHEHDINLKNDL